MVQGIDGKSVIEKVALRGGCGNFRAVSKVLHIKDRCKGRG